MNIDELRPQAIRLRTATRTLEIEWQDGSFSVWEHALLRQRCRCAECVVQQHKGCTPAAVPDIALIDVAAYGQNALRFTFSDGHARGIFPFEYLHQFPELQAPAVNGAASVHASS